MGSSRVRKEEYTTLGDFVMTSFTRDLPIIAARFIKLNAAYLVVFETKLAQCKLLDSVYALSEAQKKATRLLYLEAEELNNELTFLNSFIEDAELSKTLVTELKKDIDSRNIEGVVLKLEDVKQYVDANSAALIEEGMQSNYASTLASHAVSLASKNTAQTLLMKNKIALTAANIATYEELYDIIAKICSKGKLIFKNTPLENQYSITWNISKMRSGKK